MRRLDGAPVTVHHDDLYCPLGEDIEHAVGRSLLEGAIIEKGMDR